MSTPGSDDQQTAREEGAPPEVAPYVKMKMGEKRVLAEHVTDSGAVTVTFMRTGVGGMVTEDGWFLMGERDDNTGRPVGPQKRATYKREVGLFDTDLDALCALWQQERAE